MIKFDIHMMSSTISLDQLSFSTVKDPSDDSSISEQSEYLYFDQNEGANNITGSSSDLSPSVEVRSRRHFPSPGPREKIDLRGRRKTRMAPQPPRTGLSRSRSFNTDNTQNKIVKQGSTDSEGQISSYLDLPTKKRTQSPFLSGQRDKSRFKALKDALRSPRHIRKNSKKEKMRDSPTSSNSRTRKITVTSVPDNFTYGILPEQIDQDCEFEVKRIAEYDRYLQNLLAETHPSHQDYKTLNSAVKRVNAIKHIADLNDSNTEVNNEADTSDYPVQNDSSDHNLKSKTLPNNKREGSSAIVFKHLTVGSKFRAGSNWTQNMGWKPDADYDGFGNNDTERMYVMEGPVQFALGSNTQDRYLFLFSDVLLIAKEKSSSTFKLKYRINVTDLWIATCVETASDNSMPADRSFVIGWASTHLVATFGDTATKDMWLKNILDRCNAEKAKQQYKALAAAARQSQDSDDSEDEAYFEETSNKRNNKSKKSPMILNIFKKSSREETNANELMQAQGKLFGQPLEAVCTTDNEPSKHVLSMLEIVFREGTYTTGILRKSANARLCRDIKKHIDEADNISLEDHQVLAIGSVLKDYLRSIPKSLLIDDLYDDWMKAEKLEEKGEQIKKVKELLSNKLPTCHLTLLKYVICVLQQIDKNSEENKMSASNLAVCIAPSLLASKRANTNTSQVTINGAIKVVQLMIENCAEIFGENVIYLFGSSIDRTNRQDSDSDSMHSILSMQESNGGTRRDGSSMDSLVEGELLYQGDSSPKPVKSHLSPSNLSRDSGLTLSDSQLYDDDLPEIGHPDKKAYLRSISIQDRDIGLYSRSLESTSSFEQEPIAPPRKKKDFTSSSSFETFINYPRPQSTFSRIGAGRAVRSHPDLGKRLSGDSLKSVEESAEDSDMQIAIGSRTISSKFRESDPVLASRDKMTRQRAISDTTPPLSPLSQQSQSNSCITSSRDSLTSESSRSYDTASLQSNQYFGDELPDSSYVENKYDKESDIDSFSSTIVVNHFGSHEKAVQNGSHNGSSSSDHSLPIQINRQSQILYPTDNSPTKLSSSPIISVTQCSSSSDEILENVDDDDFGFKKAGTTPPMELPQQRNRKPKVDKNYGSPPPRVVLGNLKDLQKIHTECPESGVFHARTHRRNSLDSLSDFRIEQKSNDIKFDRVQNAVPRERITVIHRTRIPSPYVTNFVSSMTDLSKLKSENTKRFSLLKLDERTRPSEPPSYNEAVQRNFRILHGLPLEISDQDTVKQKEASARAKQLYQQSLQTYLTEFDTTVTESKSSVASSDESTSGGITAQINEDNDVYVTLSRNPRKIYEESKQLYEKSSSRVPSSNRVCINVTPDTADDSNSSQTVNLYRSQSDVAHRPTSKLTIKLHEQNSQTQSTSCLEMNSQNSKHDYVSATRPPSYKVAISTKQHTIQDYTQPEATQIPIIVEQSDNGQNVEVSSKVSVARTKPEQVVSRKKIPASKTKIVSAGEALPWSVSAIKQMWDTKRSLDVPSDSEKPMCPPPYTNPPPFKRDSSVNRMSVSSNSSGGSFSSQPNKNLAFKRSGPQHVDQSFSSSEDLYCSGSLSHVREDSVDSSDHDYTDVSYV